jgi:transcription elongation factor GreA
MGNDILLSKEGYEKLKAELEELRGPVRQRIADAIREAKSHGDLKENAAYHEAKLNQQRNESRIGELERALQVAKIIERPHGAREEAHLGSRVKLRDKTYRDELVILLVGSFEADPLEDKISITSPLGVALMGKTVGDHIEVEAPAGLLCYEILEITHE